MEAVPRLHMMWFALKSSPEGTSYAALKKYIAEYYHEDAEAYSKEVLALETLRNQAMRTTKDGSSIMKRYYCQLLALQNRFPQLSERGIFTYKWKDLYRNTVHEISDMRFERAAVLFNIAASHTQSGATVTRSDLDGMKVACTHFQAAAWAYEELRERYANVNDGGDFMTTELLVFMQQVCLAQAQECILEKSLIDNRKPPIVAKVTAQIVVYYGAALAALLTGGDDGPVSQVIDNTMYKMWIKYVRFKISYLHCILYLYQGQHAEEQRKMGERVTLYQAAWEKLEEARKESKGLPDQKDMVESLSFTADVVEAKRKNAKNENEFIYHETVPELSSIAAVQGANLVKGIGFAVTDDEFAGTDIFARLVPMKAHEASSMYSEEKAKLLRKYGQLIEEKDNELNGYMSSLTLDNLNINEEHANKLPQGIVDRCAALHANKSAISDLIEAMSQLAEITADVETNLSELAHMLEAEAQAEREFQTTSGVQRTPNAHITELTREYQKYSEAHARAGESNNTLRKAMSLHVNNLKILARPLNEIQQLMPRLSSELNTAEIFKDVKLIVNKVNEMMAQRAQFHADLRIAVNDDDITAKVIAHGGNEGLQALFSSELAKHERLTQLMDQNLLAQQNILQALTEAYARAAPVLKTLQDVKQKREHFYSSLAASYDVYEDLLAKSAKGLEFYKKLAGNVQKLLTRFRSARDVQSEERQQRLKSVATATATATPTLTESPTPTAASSAAPKLRDYLKAKSAASIVTPIQEARPYVPPVRPVPVGSENPTQAACSSTVYATAPNEPPPPYSLQQQQYYDPSAAGYTNPMYQQQQQNLAPPAYKAQASPNSQTLHSAMAQLSLQQQQQQEAAYAQPAMPYGSYNWGANQPAAQPTYNNYQQPLYVATSNANEPPAANYMLQAAQPPTAAAYNAPPMAQQSYNLAYAQATPAPQAAAAAPYPAYAQQQNALYAQPAAQPLPYAQQYNNEAAAAANNPAPAAQPLSYAQQYNEAAAAANNLAPAAQAQPYAPQYNNEAAAAVNNLAPAAQSQPYAPQYNNEAAAVATNPTPPYAQQFNVEAAAVASNAMPAAVAANYPSYGNHPGYSFNPQTGIYDYSSGYQQESGNASQATLSYGHFTKSGQQAAVVGTTDSESANKTNLATGFDSPVISHTKAAATMEANSNNMQTATTPAVADSQPSANYYTPPYGYHSNDTPTQNNSSSMPNINPPAQQPAQQTYNAAALPSSKQQQQQQQLQQPLYMQSGSSSIASTQTSSSSAEYASSTAQVQAPAKNAKNIDLLSDLDCSNEAVPPPMLPQPVLQPQPVTSKAEQPTEQPAELELPAALPTLSPLSSPLAATLKRNGSLDNLSQCSDISSLENFDWDAVSLTHSASEQLATTPHNTHTKALTFQMQLIDPFSDAKTLKYFHKEVESYEKLVENLHVKMLNGNTQLSAKWQELQQKLDKDTIKRTTTIAKLFPEKNRSLDCLPYDHARVKLDKQTDDYINAAHMKNLSAGCPNFIIAQTPQANTINDFWSMIWSQKSRTVMCLHTISELFEPYWPQALDQPTHYDDYTVCCVKLQQLSHCTAYQLKLSLHGADAVLDLTLLQLKQWTKASPTQLLGIADNALQTHQQNCLAANAPTSPLIMNCLTGSERCELLAIAICALLATQTKRPILINVVDVWSRICKQRQNSLRDTAMLEQSMQIVLAHAHDVLNKRGIMTSYQMKMAPQVTAKEQLETKDPLNELDALWKLK